MGKKFKKFDTGKRDATRDRDGTKAKRRNARRSKAKRRTWESSSAD